jgi:hypothetical protein
LKSNGFELVGSYMPAKDKNRYIVCFTSNEILSAVKKLAVFAVSLPLGE